MPDKPVDAEILTIKEVSEYLKVTERTIYRLAAAKKIPGFKVGGAWRFSKAEIDQWIRRQSEDGASDADVANTEAKDDD
ncbi:MAG: DNA-binding protein [Pelagibaca sp.]|nr:DNA-binding protein [Pelagibaca sp.]|tara:strand:+ start:17140 stop:17376 length:237 start_codon:yes stop_codon:yes gene_type:complete